MDKAARGAAALSNSDYSTAINEYTAAIKENPNAVKYYIERSTAYQRSQKYPQALADAEYAVVLAHKRASRDLIKQAQLRRAIALFFVERYADAEFVFDIVKRLDEKEKSLPIWIAKVAKKLKELDEGDARGKLAAKEVPEVEAPGSELDKNEEASEGSLSQSVKPEASQTGPSSSTPIPTQPSKIKHDWYQNTDTVFFTLLAKGVDKEKAVVDITKDTLSITFPVPDPSNGSTSDFSFDIDPFYLEIDPAASSFQIKATKVEVKLKKAIPGTKWHALEGTRAVSSPSTDKPTIPQQVLAYKTSDAPPAYPTSSRKGAKDWDKVAADLSKKKAKGAEGEDDDGGIDDYGTDETSAFFKKLYSGATPEQQRAMMKSYSESGGTVLSTDWSSVGKKTVVPEPPEGMEAKKY